MYGLLLNDTLVLATCKHYGIKHLISIDSDFPEPCKKEGIILINSAEKLNLSLSSYHSAPLLLPSTKACSVV
ncbi:MAG: PIN domain-containing protein [Thermodesulfobacteria bacterium]|nr:PIN domain-containing protein [Thermodesulfobacteriota bacterium]